MPKGPIFILGKRNNKKGSLNSPTAPAIPCSYRVSKQPTARTGHSSIPPLNSLSSRICNVTVKYRGGGRRIIQTRKQYNRQFIRLFISPTCFTVVFLSQCHSSWSNPLSENALNASSSRLKLRINLSPRGKEFSFFILDCLQYQQLKPAAT
jgi:hypothetical protein